MEVMVACRQGTRFSVTPVSQGIDKSFPELWSNRNLWFHQASSSFGDTLTRFLTWLMAFPWSLLTGSFESTRSFLQSVTRGYFTPLERLVIPVLRTSFSSPREKRWLRKFGLTTTANFYRIISARGAPPALQAAPSPRSIRTCFTSTDVGSSSLVTFGLVRAISVRGTIRFCGQSRGKFKIFPDEFFFVHAYCMWTVF